MVPLHDLGWFALATLAMALTLVYSADHFVFDILLGWAYVIVVVLTFRYFTPRLGVPRAPLRRTTDAKTE